MKCFVTIMLFAFYTISMYGQFDRVSSRQVIMSKNCDGDLINGTIELFCSSEEPIEIFNLHSKICEIQFFLNGQSISKNDTLLMPADNRLKIDFEFINYESEDKLINYSTSINEKNEVRLHLGSYQITHNEVKSGSRKLINIGGNCSDSIKIFFPYGGTISGIAVYRNEKDEEYIKSISYGLGDENNFIKFARNEVGEYYINYAACHWGESFWLELLNE